MKTIAFTNQKGGVGKTTSVINCGAALARQGKTVLLVDLDPQAHLTLSMGHKAHELEQTIYELLKGEVSITEAIITQPGGLQLLPSSINLAAAEMELAGQAGREYLLKRALKQLKKKPDFILIDCPPSLGLFTLNGLAAADEAYIPLQTEYLALYGTGQLLQVVEVVKERLNDKLKVGGIILTMYNSRININNEVAEMIKENFADLVFNTHIRQNVSLSEAPSHGLDIFTYKANSPGAADYAALADEIIGRA
jgi:chromosome partitioning protein